MDLKIKILNGLKRFYPQEPFTICKDYVQKKGQDANDYIYQRLSSSPTEPLMIAKFGTVELGVVGAYELKYNYRIASYLKDFMKGRVSLYSANSTSKCKITKCFCKSTPLVLRNSISFLVSH